MTTLLVASNGGHLKQIHRLRDRFEGASHDYRWATFDTPQARSLLAEERVDFVPFIGGRDPRNVARNLPHARRILKQGDVDAVISTGSAIALPFFATARARRTACHYIESAARIEGPSMTGKLVSKVPGVNLYSQYQAWAQGRWSFRGAVFDSFVAAEGGEAPEIRKVLVTLGTYKGTPYLRIVKRLLEILPAGVEVTWQTGATDVTELGIEGIYAMPEHELSEAMREADVVVTHAGVGSALAALEVGKCPVLAPRRQSLGEAIDDHQAQIAELLAGQGLAVAVDADELSLDDLVEAARKRVAVLAEPPAFELA